MLRFIFFIFYVFVIVGLFGVSVLAEKYFPNVMGRWQFFSFGLIGLCLRMAWDIDKYGGEFGKNE